GTADGVGQMELQLGRIEGSLAGKLFPTKFFGIAAGRGDGVPQGLLGPVPHFVGTETLVRAQRELDRVRVEAEVAIDAVEQVAEGDDFIDQLVFAAEDVRIVLSELADA